MTPAIRQLLFDRPLIKQADGYWDAEFYDSTVDALVDRNMRGIGNARLGSAVGPDTNDPSRPTYGGEKYALFPGTAGNQLSLPNPWGAVDYEITYLNGTTATNSSAANPILFGGTDVQFAGLSVKSISVTQAAVEVALFAANAFTSESTIGVDGYANTWTIVRGTAAGSKLHIIDRTCVLGNLVDYCIVTSGLPTIGTGDFTISGVALMPFATPDSNIGGSWYLGPLDTLSGGGDSINYRLLSNGNLDVLKRIFSGANQTVAIVPGFVATWAGKWVALTISKSSATWLMSVNGLQLFSNNNFANEAVGSLYLGIGCQATAYTDFPVTKTAFFTRALSLDEHRRLAIEMGASV